MKIKNPIKIGDYVAFSQNMAILFINNNRIDQDVTNFYYDKDNKKFIVTNQLVVADFKNYNPNLQDIGIEQINDVRGYGDDYVSDKTLAYCKIGGDSVEETGGIRVKDSVFQMYLNNEWEQVVTNFIFREDSNGDYELEHKPDGFSLWIEVMSGNSDLVDPDGNPLIQQYKINIGMYSTPLEIDGGTFD